MLEIESMPARLIALVSAPQHARQILGVDGKTRQLSAPAFNAAFTKSSLPRGDKDDERSVGAPGMVLPAMHSQCLRNLIAGLG